MTQGNPSRVLRVPLISRFRPHILEPVQARLRSRENLFFTALIIIHLIPIWAFRYFPSQDGPAHINNANIIREYHSRPVFREYYVLNKDLVPNWFGHLVMAGLMYLVPALVAEKILLSGYVILTTSLHMLRASHHLSHRDLSDRPHFPVRL
jgi:hypothetical protein